MLLLGECSDALVCCQCKQPGMKGRQDLKKLVYMDDVGTGAAKLVLSPVSPAPC